MSLRRVAAAALLATALGCRNALDCSLNGACTGGACVCSPGWTGSDCGFLDLQPAAPISSQAFYRNDSASWGGSILQGEDGLWHAFIAVMEGHCGLNSWVPNSAIYHAVSSTASPAGPYVNETKVLDWFSHNPTASRAPDGSFLVWHIGCGNGGGGFVYNCTNGTTPTPPPPPPVHIHNGDPVNGCLRPSGEFPCWSGGTGKVCPLVVGNCSDPLAGWSLEGNTWVNTVSGADLNIDCNSCEQGAVAKAFGAGGSGVAYNASTLQIMDTECDGMCLTTGKTGGATPPCGGGGEPWFDTQVHVAPCSSPDTQGWHMVSPGSSERALREAEARASVYPAPCSDVNVLVSQSVYGPWVQTGIITGNRVAPIFELDNPAPFHFPNGTTWVMGRSWHPPGNTTTPIGIARSDTASWNTTYTILNVTYPQYASVNATQLSYVPLEDPFMWQDAATGSFHALFHNMGGCQQVGCHAFSPDGYTWYLSPSGAYTTNITFSDGTWINVHRRERPHVVFNAAGQPAFLSNGVQPGDADHTYTHVQRTSAAWP